MSRTTSLSLQSLPLTTRARRTRSRRADAGLLGFVRRVWAACERLSLSATCDRCGGPMLECRLRGDRRLCIQCVSDEVPVDWRLHCRPQDAGGAAVLRALLREMEFSLSGALRPGEQLRAQALLDTAEIVVWWMTPPNLRIPRFAKLDDAALKAHISRFDEVWGLRASDVSLATVYRGWSASQNKAQQYAALSRLDRAYAELVLQGQV
jgi:hypothetical protein